MKQLEFVRYGGLSPVNHKKFYKTDTFHSPPVKKGIYAFIFPYIEDFLWAWKTSSDRKKYSIRNRKKFKYNGLVWIHLIGEATKLNCGLEYKKTWVKIHTDNLNECIELAKQKDRIALESDGPIHDPYKRGLGGWMSRDHLECFIERVK